MSNKINSKILGELRQDENFDDWWLSKEVAIPFFDNKKLIITFSDFVPEEDSEFIAAADAGLTHFLGFNTSDRLAISNLAYKNCMDFLEAIGFDEADAELWEIKDEHDIWNFISPEEIYVTRRPYKEQDIYIQIACECAWEQEHGLQFVFRQGKKLTRVSNQDGHLTEADAYAKPDEEDELLSKF
jgi:hypothetical protein